LSLIQFCASVGKKLKSLFIVCTEEEVCRVDITKCHVSANSKAALTVSVSLISHTIIISGSSLIAHLKALENEFVSLHTSLCEKTDLSSLNINSTGSSIVNICSHLVLFISSSIDIIVVDFQDQVGHVISISHCFNSVNTFTDSGNHKS